ncbi:hypothetical protein [Streptosporangium sp. OZ121]
MWQHYESTYSQLYAFGNHGWDQVMANGGGLDSARLPLGPFPLPAPPRR